MQQIAHKPPRAINPFPDVCRCRLDAAAIEVALADLVEVSSVSTNSSSAASKSLDSAPDERRMARVTNAL